MHPAPQAGCAGTVLIIKGVRESTLSVGKSRARNPTSSNKIENQKEKTAKQSTTFRLKPYDTASDDDDASVVDEANAYAEGSVFRSQAGAGSAVDDPGGGIDDPGGGDTDDLGSFGNLATSTGFPG